MDTTTVATTPEISPEAMQLLKKALIKKVIINVAVTGTLMIATHFIANAIEKKIDASASTDALN